MEEVTVAVGATEEDPMAARRMATPTGAAATRTARHTLALMAADYGYSSGHDHHDHHDYDDDRRRSSSSNKKDKNDTLYRYRGKTRPDGNHTIDWWHSRGYQRSQLDFAD